MDEVWTRLGRHLDISVTHLVCVRGTSRSRPESGQALTAKNVSDVAVILSWRLSDASVSCQARSRKGHFMPTYDLQHHRSIITCTHAHSGSRSSVPRTHPHVALHVRASLVHSPLECVHACVQVLPGWMLAAAGGGAGAAAAAGRQHQCSGCCCHGRPAPTAGCPGC
jgi:hypothetical protein